MTRGAIWAEIKNDVWTVPAARMKAKKDHAVPLPAAALAILDRQRGQHDTLIFPGMNGEQLSDMTLTAVCKRLGVEAVPHGFRSTFADWRAESTDYTAELQEAALAQALKDKTQAAYQRGTMFDKRRALMDDWAAYCSAPVE